MFDFLKKKSSQNGREGLPELFDLDKKPLNEGDMVESLRYELGVCKIVLSEETFYYESIDSGEKVSWVRMIDAATELQKVKRLDSD